MKVGDILDRRRNNQIAYRKIARRKRRIKMIRNIIITILVMAALVFFVYLCQANTIEVTGNNNYSADMIKKEIFTNKATENILYQNLMGLINKKVELPYLTTYEIKYPALDAMTVVVYEKEPVAYIETEKGNALFDKQGVVLRIEAEVPTGIPRIEGLKVDEVKEFDTIPAKDVGVFNMIKNLVSQLRKNELNPDKIVLDDASKMDLYFGSIVVKIGTDDSLENKIARYIAIKPSLEGKSGILYLDDVDETTDNISFIKTKQ